MHRVNRPAWLVVHVVNIISHVGMILSGFVTFAASAIPRRSTYGQDSRISLVFTLWAACTLGVLGTTFNFYLILALRSATQPRSGAEQERFFRKQLAFSIGGFFTLINILGDYAITHALARTTPQDVWLYGTLGFCAFSVVVGIVMMSMDIAVFCEERKDYRRATEPEDDTLALGFEHPYRDEH